MVQCKACNGWYDETIASGICPHCGHIEEHAIEPEKENIFVDPRWLPEGTLLNDRYEIKEVIGAGGFGVTYKAWDRHSSVYKAIKEYFQQGVVNRIPGTTEVLISAPKQRAEFEYGKKRLIEEAKIVAKFQSPSIVRVDGYFEENNTSYMVMEYLSLDTLEDFIIKRKQVLTPTQAVKIGVNICDALSELHQAGVVHRDIAPDNVFVTEDGTVKIIDFGSARLSKEDTNERLIVAKPGFTPPEQYEKIDLSNDKQQAWTDIYALGATLYLALTGVVPAESSNRKSDMDKNADSVKDPATINQNIPEFLNNTIMQAMAVDIHERFKTADEMKQALLQQKKVEPLPIVRKKKKIRRTAGIAGGLIAAAILILIGTRWYQNKKADAVIPPSHISIWYSVSNNEDAANRKNAVMEAIVAGLDEGETFKNVEVELRAIPEDTYQEELEKASEEGKMPTLFESTGCSEGVMAKTEDVGDAIDRVDSEQCFFISEYSEGLQTRNQLPTGFNMPVIYVNKSQMQNCPDIATVSSMEELFNLCGDDMKDKSFSVDPAYANAFAEMLPDFSSYASNYEGYTTADFYGRKTVALFSDTSQYFNMRRDIEDHVVMIFVNSDQLICHFTNYWSIGECSDEELMAAKSLWAYFMINYPQDIYYAHDSQLPGLPLEQRALEAYAEVNPIFKGMFDDTTRFVFDIQY